MQRILEDIYNSLFYVQYDALQTKNVKGHRIPIKMSQTKTYCCNIFISPSIHTHKSYTNTVGTVKLLSSIFHIEHRPHSRGTHKLLISHPLGFNICVVFVFFQAMSLFLVLHPCMDIKIEYSHLFKSVVGTVLVFFFYV